MSGLPLAYCERLSSGAEPLNIASNLAYVVVALWLLLRGAGSGTAGTHRFDAALLFSVALFSALFHARPTPTAQLLDVLAIALTVGVLLHRALRYRAATDSRTAALLVVLWASASALLARYPTVLSGSLLYAPTVVALAALAWRIPQHRRALVLVLGLFALALAARTLDRPLCTLWPRGTHPAWHLLGAAALAVFVHILDRPRA